MLKYHPANYDTSGKLNIKKPFHDFYSAVMIYVKGSPTNVNLVLKIKGSWQPILSEALLNQKIQQINKTDVCPNDTYKSFCNNYIGAHAQISVDNPHDLYFDGKNTKIVTENIIEKLSINKESAEITIQKIDFANKNALHNGMDKINPGNCIGTHTAGVNCKFFVNYKPLNKKLFYSGSIRVYYTIKMNLDVGYLDIPFTINST